MHNAIFITGTDTGVGKTIVTGLLAQFLTEKGIRTITQKWVQTGCSLAPQDIIQHMSSIPSGPIYIKKYYKDMVPYVFKFASSPHLAAFLEKRRIDTERIEDSFKRLTSSFDFVIVEGTGGALVPVNSKKLLIDIVGDLNLPVLIVAKNRLGAINHTLLTIEALRKRNLNIAGIVFNRLQEESDDQILKDNMDIVEKFAGVKVLGELPYRVDKHTLYANFTPIGEQLLKLLNL